ncbi:PepSY domain-containing protein [Pseudaminobacter sp. 19-2017]|uniref:PepSY domain-containing protein n=1 Tax=Pseudaminobacter soli (ex Zhang et al. 2022) TaxID=2831468 RepID=A0A942IAS4_9HYPH|nr:PepSY domain-containing protein [Pseudaminobacter soli]MBS3651605.1 PepSY domain-containing protein [Pseudaminobacter soli]
MRSTLTILACVAVLPVGQALAKDECFVPMAEWKPKEAVAALAAQKGWTVRRIKIDDGCYEIDGTDAQGQRIEVTIHPSSLEILEIEQDGAGHRHRDGEGHHDDQ